MAVHTGIGLTLVGTSVLAVLIFLPLWLGRVKMNWLYGVRITKAFESDELWLEINRYGGRLFVIWSVLLLVIGIVSIIIPYPEDGIVPPVVSLTPVIIYLIAAIQTYLYSRKL